MSWMTVKVVTTRNFSPEGAVELRMALEVGEPKYHESERDEARTCHGDGPGSEPPEPISVHRVLLNVRAVPKLSIIAIATYSQENNWARVVGVSSCMECLLCPLGGE